MIAGLAPFVIFLAVVLLTQIVCKWNTSDFARHPDEAGHFISGTLVADWLADAQWAHPMAYAREYYARFPRVAIGHWPPVFYAIQGVWYRAFGVSRLSAMLLTACIAASFLTLILNGLRKRVGLIGAIIATLLVFWSAVFQYAVGTFMADLLTATLSLAAAEQFDRFLDKRLVRYAIGFGILASAAILTKQDAIALAAIPPLCVVLTRRWRLLADWRFYLPALVVGILALPFSLWSVKFTTNALEGVSRHNVFDLTMFFVEGTTLEGWLGAILAGLGAMVCFVPRLRPSGLGTWGIVLSAWTLGFMLLHVIVPVSVDPRYTVQILPFAALLAACAVQFLATTSFLPKWLGRGLVAALLLGMVVLPGTHVAPRVSGYQSIVDAIPKPHSLRTILVCSDTKGDGAIACALRLKGRPLNYCMLRADQQLASSNWNGNFYKLRYAAPSDVNQFISKQSIQYVILDDWGAKTPHGKVLCELVEHNPERYRLLGTYPINRFNNAKQRHGMAQLIAVSDQADKRLETVHVRLPASAGGDVVCIKPWR